MLKILLHYQKVSVPDVFYLLEYIIKIIHKSINENRPAIKAPTIFFIPQLYFTLPTIDIMIKINIKPNRGK